MIQHEVIGDDMQAVILSLGPSDVVRAEAGAMMYMTDTIDMDSKMEGGFLGGLKRKFLSGESFFITYFRCTGGAGKVAFAGPYPGKIIPVDLRGQQILCQKLPGEPRPTSAERRTNADLRLPCATARNQQIGDVGARHQQTQGEDDLAATVKPYLKPGAAVVGTGAGSITGWMANLQKKLEGA